MEFQESARMGRNIMLLGFTDFGELVVGLLNAMGFQTCLNRSEGEAYMNILAKPAPLSWGIPRIQVRVKYEASAVGDTELRRFLEGIYWTELGWFISRNGFTLSAWNESVNSRRLVTLTDMDKLVILVMKYSKALDRVLLAKISSQ